MKTLQDVDKTRVPRHVAIIMDGNGRWAKAKLQRRIYGHQHAMQAVHEATEAAAELGCEYLTVYAFSTENWNRPQEEVEGLMELLIKAVIEETPTMMKNNVRLETIGDTSRIPKRSLDYLNRAIEETSKNTGLCMILALSYSSRWEIAEALKGIIADAQKGLITPDQVTEETIRPYLATRNYPDPDLLIRTG